MDPRQLAALQAFNTGVAYQTENNTNINAQQPPINQPSQPGQSTARPLPNILDGATEIDRPDDWHKPDKTFPCTWEGCGKMFTCPHNVNQHIREVHTGERPYACALCADEGIDKAFPRPGSLYRHLRTQHHVEPNIPNTRRSRKTVGRTGPMSAVPAPKPAEQPRHRGRKPKTVAQQPGTFSPPTATVMAPHPALLAIHSCDFCNAELTGHEHAMLHMHLTHGVPASATCGCAFCKSQYAQQAPEQPIEPLGFPPTASQQPPLQPTFATSLPIRQPQPRRPFSASQLEQRLLAVQQQQFAAGTQQPTVNGYAPPIDRAPTPGPDGFEMLAPADGASEQPTANGYAPPFDPAPTPDPDGSEMELLVHGAAPAQDYFGFIDYSQFADGSGDGKLPHNLDDLFATDSTSNPGNDFSF